jgi:anti-sigma factor RsiW
MDCADARLQLHDLRRDRLPPALRAEVERHLADCGGCRRAEAAEGALDDLLARALPRLEAPARLRRRIEAGAPGPARPAERRRWPGRAIPALAAALALAVVAVVVERRGAVPGASPLVEEAVTDHLRVLAAQRPSEIESGATHQVKPWFEGRLDFAPAVPLPEVADLALRGGAVGYVVDRRAAVVQYALRRHAVTLLAFQAEGLPWPGGEPPGGAGPAGLRAGGSRGFTAVLWRAGPLGYALVSDVPAAELADLARAMAPATAR